MDVGDLYATLQVDPGADTEVIEAAYRRLARKWHPDRNPDPEAVDRMQALNAAYAVLSDPESRSAYDAQRLSRRVPSPGRTAGDRVRYVAVVVGGLLGLLVVVRLLGILIRFPLLLGLLVVAVYYVLRPRRHS